MAYASDSGHWYDRQGAPCYTIIGANGRERNTTLADARKQAYVPSVTEVMKIMAKPGLERWKLEQVKLAALTLPKIENETLTEFSSRISLDANQEVQDACNLGTEIHGEIEKHFQRKPILKHQIIVNALETAIDEAFGEQDWHPEKSFSHPLGFGGKCDLHSDQWIIDYKTKDFTKENMKKPFSYLEHLMQLSAYRLGLGLPDAHIANVFISRTEPGLIKIETHKKDLEPVFIALLNYWQKLKGFDSCY